LVEGQKKVLIAPVGAYKKRVWRAIVESGAKQVYLIKERKNGWKQVTERYVSEFSRKVREDLFSECDCSESADFTDCEDICRVFVKIIEKERVIQNNMVSFLIDITSTTKEGALIAGTVAQLYGANIVYVPGKTKKEKTLSEIEQEFLSEAEDEGEPMREIKLPRPVRKAKPISILETKILERVLKGEGSEIRIRDIIKTLSKEKSPTVKDPESFSKKCHRYTQILCDRGLVEINGVGRSKRLVLTELGRGVAKGIQESLTWASISPHVLAQVHAKAI